MVDEALEAALELGITTCDACYALLARWLDLPPITADEALAHKLQESDPAVHTLMDVEL